MSSLYSRPVLSELDLPLGKRVRLRRLLFHRGPGNGRMMVLPIDQGVEHGTYNFFGNPPSKYPRYQFELALRGNYNAIACHYGFASKYLREYAGEVPLILKLNGKSSIPPDDEPVSPLISTVEDAARIGADAVGYTLYVGSPRQDEDIAQLSDVRQECETLGMPLVVWAYPRGTAVNAKGGRDSFYAVDYAARLSEECGADIVKVNFPKINPEKDVLAPAPFNTLQVSEEEALRQVVESAGRSFVLLSGGSKVNDDELLEKVRMGLRCGATGLIFGRNMWLRPMEEALAMSEKVRQILASE